MNNSIKSPIDHFSYNSLLRRGDKRAQEGDEFYSRQIDFNDVWQRFESTLGIGIGRTSVSVDVNDEIIETTSKQSNEKTSKFTEELDDDGLSDFEFVQPENLSMQFVMSELREMVQQTFKIPRELGLDSQNFACLSCGNPLGVGGSGYTTTQYVHLN